VKSILFTVNTEYHFLLAISIAADFMAVENTAIKIVLLDDSNQRLKQINDKIQRETIDLVRCDTTSKEGIHRLLDQLIKSRYDYFFHFYEFDLFNSYLINKIKKQTKIVLCEDGTAMYQTYSVKAYGSRFRQTWKLFKKSLRFNLFHFPFPVNSLKHGTSHFIDEIWLTQPELFHTERQLTVRKINLLDNNTKVDLTETYFANNLPLQKYENVVFIIGRVKYSDLYLEKEIKLIEAIIDQNVNTIFYLKVHPNTDMQQMNEYEKIEGLHIICDKIPAELYLSKLVNSQIYGIDSTAMYFFNKSCSYTVCYKYLQQLDVYPAYRTIPFPKHVNDYK
jgi:hypothetical protein